MTTAEVIDDTQLVEEILQRVASDLSMISDRDFEIEETAVERADQRPAGAGQIHISFRLGIHCEDEVKHGCVLLPLPEAISLACYLMMVPDDGVASKRPEMKLDVTTKDAMMEVANFIAGAADNALREAFQLKVKVRSEGCQGVRPDVRPALVYEEGTELIVGRARAQIHEYPGFELLLLLPLLAA